jgi:hypothetical protein
MDAERLDATGQSANGARKQQDDKALPFDVDAAIFGKFRRRADHRHAIAPTGVAEDKCRADRQHQTDDQAPVQPREVEDPRQIGRRQDRRRLRPATRPLEQKDREIGGQQHRDVVRQDRRDDFVGVVAGAEIGRDGDPGGARHDRERQRRQHVNARGQGKGEADPGGSEAAEEKLTLDADVEHAAAQADAGSDAADQDRRRLQQSPGNLCLVAEGAAQQRHEYTDRAFTDHEDDDCAHEQRHGDGDDLTGNGTQAVVHHGGSAIM